MKRADYAVIGKRFPKVDSPIKVTGQAKYLVDIKLPGMLHLKFMRSPLPHARILSVDISKARQLRGVKAAITAADIPRIKFGPAYNDRLPLEDEKVRFVGDEVAAVAAVDEDTAEEALELIKVEYDELPAVFDAEEAMQPGAPLIHQKERNILFETHRYAGDVEQGFAESAHVFEDRFRTRGVAHCCMEPHGCVAQVDASGRVTLWTGGQTPNHMQHDLALALGLHTSQVRVLNAYVGGGFGSKERPDPREIVSAHLSRMTGKPVRCVETREEEFTTMGRRHPMRINLKTGVTKDGKVLARQVTIFTDCGGYHRAALVATDNAGVKVAQLYAPLHFKYDGYAVYTNNQPGQPFRGFGSPQVHFPMESQMDMIAERLGMDPLELRLKNALKPGQVLAGGSIINSCGQSECLQLASQGIGWKDRQSKGAGRGLGIATMIHSGGGTPFPPMFINFAQSFIKIDAEGSVIVLSGEQDLGQGSDTILSQVVAEELGVRLEDVHIYTKDTDVIPSTMGSWGSRVTFTGGNAVRAAAAEVKRQLFERAADKLEANPDDLEAKDRKIYVKGTPEKAIPIVDVVKDIYTKDRKPMAAEGHFIDSYSTLPDAAGRRNPSPCYSFASQAVEIEVDKDTGQVQVLNFVAAHDLGFALNPMNAEGQIEGAAAMGIGLALTEELIHPQGKLLNPNFADFKILTALDMPPVESTLVESNETRGPFGAKGVAEPGLVPAAPAIASAIYQATGVRMRELPITPERLLRAIREKEREKA